MRHEQAPPRRPDVPDPAARDRLSRRDRFALGVAVALGLALVAAMGIAIGAMGPDGRGRLERSATPAPTAPAALKPSPAVDDRTLDYAFLSTRFGGPARWNPCEPIRYAVNLEHAPPGSMRILRRAVQRIEEPTGLRFSFVGATDEPAREDRPRVQRARYGPGWAPVLVSWLAPTDREILLPKGRRALGLTWPTFWPTEDAETQAIVTGQIVIVGVRRQPPGFAQPNAVGLVMMHELGHLVGLGHVRAFGEVMDPNGGGALGWGPGDLEGLRRLGRDAGCFDTPRPP